MLSYQDMDPSQKQVYDAAVNGLRGKAPAPLAAWIASPEMAGRAQHLGEFLRYQTSLTPRLSELAILVTAREWTAHYEWFAHKKEAIKAGLESSIIDAIAEHRTPDFLCREDTVIYDFSLALHTKRRISEPAYSEAVNLFGAKTVSELVGIIGYYTFVAMTLNVFEIELPNGVQTDLKD